MSDQPKSRKPYSTIALLLVFAFLLTPFGSQWMRTTYLSFKNGNIVGQASPGKLDGVEVATPRKVASLSDQAGWVLWSFFSPT